MSFGKRKSKKLTVLKNERRKKRNQKSIIYDDELFANFFVNDECRNDQSVNYDTDDTETADEYYVIFDKPYSYYDHDDLDLFVQSESASVFGKFKEIFKSIENENFMCFISSDQVRFVQLYDNDILKVMKAVTVDKNFHVTIQVNEQKLSTSHDIWRYDRVPRVCHTSRALEHILKVVDSYSVCVGNPDKDLQELVPMGSFLDSKDGMACQGYRTLYSGNSTIVSTSCQLLVSNKRCKSCQSYRGTLRSILCRRDDDRVRTPYKHWLHSRIPNKKLSDNQKLFKLKQYEDYTKSLKKENSSLKRQIKVEIDTKGVELSSEESVDIIQIMNENEPMASDYQKENEHSYQKLFWEQQKKI